MVGIYSKSYKQKKVSKQVPDAVVYVNNSPLLKICPKCSGQINVNKFITQIGTSLSSNTTVGTANFNIAIPKHGHKGAYMSRSGKIFGINLMDEIDIFMKARIPNEAGEYQLHKVFWGMVTSIDESYSSGVQNISVSCESILKWLQLMKTNEHPSANVYAATEDRDGGSNSILTSKSYADMNVYEIIQSTVDMTFRNMVIADALYTERVQTNDETIDIGPITPADKQLLQYWQQRFKEIKSSLRLFGISGIQEYDTKNNSRQQVLKGAVNDRNGDELVMMSEASTPISIQYDSKALMDFKPFVRFDEGKSIDVLHNTYRNNLEIINEVKLYTGYEFYMDTTGELIFKPPFWNLDTSQNPVYTLKDTDIISYAFNESESEVRTRIEVVGSQISENQTDAAINPRANFTNYNLARQFGLRTEQINARQFLNADFCYYHAISELDRINANRLRGNVTIVGRPELRLGLPVYIESRDMFGYIENISHNFTFGGQFTTSIQLSSIRRKYTGEDGLVSGLQYNENGRAFGMAGKRAILIYEKSEEILQEIKKGNKYASVPVGVDLVKESQDRSRLLASVPNSNYRTNRSGVYREYDLTDEAAVEILRELDKAKAADDQNSYLRFLDVAIPVSDEDGYELIGIYENGRSFFLDKFNKLQKKGDSFSDILSGVLKKANKKNSYTAREMTVTEQVVKPNEAQNTSQEVEESRLRSKSANISSFLNARTKSINEVAPDESIDLKKCDCFDSSLTANPNNNSRPGKKPIGNVEAGRR